MNAVNPLLTQNLALTSVWKAIPAVTPVQLPQQAGLCPTARGPGSPRCACCPACPSSTSSRTNACCAESARFFYVDRAWTDALIQGALAVGAVTDADRALLQQLYPAIRDDLDQAERQVRVAAAKARSARPTRSPACCFGRRR